MKLQQISVFLENRPGHLGALCKVLADSKINLNTLSLADSGEFGLLRLITSEPERARQVLQTGGYAHALTEVMALEVPNHPGGLAQVLSVIDRQQIGVEYMYAFAAGCSGSAVMIFRFSDMDKALQALKSEGIKVYEKVDLLG